MYVAIKNGKVGFYQFEPTDIPCFEIESIPICPYSNTDKYNVVWKADIENKKVWYELETIVKEDEPSQLDEIERKIDEINLILSDNVHSEYKDKYTTLVGEDFLDASPAVLRCNIQSLITANTANGTLLINVEPFIDEWVAGTMSQPIEHTVSDVARYQNQVYVCKQTHTHHGESGLDPATYHAGWVLKHTKDASNPKPFVAESHNPYMKDEVALATDGFVYKSLIDNNVWEPTSYPQGWQKVEKELQ